jgi:hypothetical protein
MQISYSDSIKKVHLSKRGERERDHAEFAMSWPCNCKCANNALPPMAMCPVAVGHSHDASNKQGRSHACMIPHACHMHRLLPTLLAPNMCTLHETSHALCDMMRGAFRVKAYQFLYHFLSQDTVLAVSPNARLLLSYGCRRAS